MKSEKSAIAAPRLTVELIPMHQSNLNLRFALLREDWRRLRKRVVRGANGACQICGAKADRLECHESWSFDDGGKIQTLVALMALCRLCHLAKHIGQSEWAGVDYDEVETHLARLNGWSLRITKRYVKEAWLLHKRRSRLAYDVDLSYVHQFGLHPLPFYESLSLGEAGDSEISLLAKKTARESRRRKWIAIYRSSHACFDMGTVEPWTSNRRESDRLFEAFAKINHEHGTLVGLYPRGTTEGQVLRDLEKWITQRDSRLHKMRVVRPVPA